MCDYDRQIMCGTRRGFTLIELPVVRKCKCAAFTLIELLVVIAIIVLLLAILTPSLRVTRELTERAVCAAQLKQIAQAFQTYQTHNNGFSHPSPNYGLWEKPLGTVLPADHPNAYWGVAYAPYLNGERRVFRCPTAKRMDTDPGYTDWVNQPECTYGLNTYGRAKQTPTLRNPTGLILAQDAFEHLLDGNGDLLAQARWESINLTQWRYRGGLYEYFRHRRQCNIVWCDGHVSSVLECTDYPMEAYTGLDRFGQ